MNERTTTSGGVGIGGALFLVFLTLKLCDVINWSWWWVTAPLWIPGLLVIGISLVAFAIAGVMHLLEVRH